MKTIILFTIFTCIFASTFSIAQNLQRKSSFISGLVGVAQINNSSNGTETPLAFSLGGSFGYPITKNLFLYTRGSYTSKSNFQSFYNTSYLTSQIQLSDQFVEVNSSFSQLLLNGGLLYNFYLSDEFTFGLSGGLTFSVLNQEAKLAGGHVISSISNETIWGYFGGMMVEKGWGDKNITTYIEAQYNYAESDAAFHANALNRMNFSFGIKYYLSKRNF
jgi:hypothetical protein